MLQRFYFVLIAFCSISNAQFIDNYGIRIGSGISNQYWDYKNELFSDLSEWKENKLGLTIYLNCEKKIINPISIRSEIGYIQKGFKENITFVFPDDEGDFQVVNNKVAFHDLSTNLGIKVIPIQMKFKPYFLVGLRGDYLLKYKDIEVNAAGTKYGMYEDYFDEFNRFILSGTIGFGLSYNEIIYLDFEYSPAITKSYNNAMLAIRERYIDFTIGLNINKLRTKK